MKKASKGRNNQHELDALLKEFRSTNPKGLQEKTIKNFILHTLYFFNLTLNEENGIGNILDAIEKKFNREFRLTCEKLLKTNKDNNTRASQNKALQKFYKLPLLTGDEGEYSYERCCFYVATALDMLRLFLSLNTGEDVNKRYSTAAVKDRKVSLLEIACGINSTALIEELIFQGAHYKSQDIHKNPLEVCSRRNHSQSSRYLFDKGYVFIQSEPLLREIYCHAFDFANTIILSLLLQHNLTLSSELESTKEGRSENPMLVLKFVKTICHEGENQELLRIFELFLQAGYRVDGVDEFGETALSYALSFKCLEVFRLMMLHAKTSLSAVVNHVSMTDCCVLTRAVSLGNEHFVTQLLDSGADPNPALKKTHLLPLHIAKYLKNDSMISLLKAKGAQECSSDLSVTAMRSETLEVALQRLLIYAIYSRNLKLTRRLLSSGESADLLKVDLRSPLFYAMISYVDAINGEQKECSRKIFEELIKFDVDVHESVYHDRFFPPLHFCMKHDLSIFIPSLMSKQNSNAIINPVLGHPLRLACSENSVDSLRAYLASGGKFPINISEIINLITLVSSLNFYEISKELIVQFAVKLIPSEYQEQFFKLFSTSFLKLYDIERVVYQNSFMEVLCYLSWFVGFPEKIEDIQENKDLLRIKDEMLEHQKTQESIRGYVLEKVKKYCEQHQIKMEWKFTDNVLKCSGEISKVQIIDGLKAMGVEVRESSDTLMLGLYFPYPSKEFLEGFGRLVALENYAQEEPKTEMKNLVNFNKHLTLAKQARQLAQATLRKRAEALPARCWNGLIDEDHLDVFRIKYSDNYVVLLESILEDQGCTQPLIQKMKKVKNFGSSNLELIARLEGDPLFQDLIFEDGSTQKIPLSHRLTVYLSSEDKYCSVALGLVISDDQHRIFHVGVQFVNNNLSKPEHLAELAEKSKQPISIISNTLGVLCTDKN